MPGSLAKVLADVTAERVAQDVMWGIQERPDGTSTARTAEADAAKRELERAKDDEAHTWRHILHEEVLEAFAEEDQDRLRTELVQVAAVAVKWIQALDRRGSRAPHQVKKARFRTITEAHVLLIRDGDVLLGRRRNTGYADGQWQLPSGHLEEGESVAECAIREAREEVGVEITGLRFARVDHRAPERVGFYFVAESWDGEPYNAEPDKCSELAWHPLGALPADTVACTAQAVREILDGQSFGLHGWIQDA